MTNKQLRTILEKYPDDCEITIEHSNYCGVGVPQTVIAVYEDVDDFVTPTLVIEYEIEK